MKQKRLIGEDQWLVFFMIIAVFSLAFVFVLQTLGLSIKISLLSGVGLFLMVLIYALIRGYLFLQSAYPLCKTYQADNSGGSPFIAVPENHAVILRVNGAYTEPLHAGYFLPFPFFKFIVFDNTVFLGEFDGVIFDGNKEDEIDFANRVSAPVEAKYLARVYRPKRAGERLSAEEISLVADILGMRPRDVPVTMNESLYYNVLNASISKYAKEDGADANIKDILMSFLRTKLGAMSSVEARERMVGRDYLDSDIKQDIIRRYGIEVISINISDINLSPEEVEVNRTLYEASVRKEVAENERAIEIIKAEARARSLELEGEGLEKKIANVVRSGATAQEVLEYLTKMKQWESMKESDKSLVLDSGGSLGGLLAAIKTIIKQ